MSSTDRLNYTTATTTPTENYCCNPQLPQPTTAATATTANTTASTTAKPSVLKFKHNYLIN